MLTGVVDPKLNVGGYCAPEGLVAMTAVSATLPVKLPVGVTVMVDVFAVLAPGVTVTVVPVIVKLGTGRLTVYAPVATALAEYPVAVAIASSVSVAETLIGLMYLVDEVVGVVPSVV
jgi:hypothetical protein